LREIILSVEGPAGHIRRHFHVSSRSRGSTDLRNGFRVIATSASSSLRVRIEAGQKGWLSRANAAHNRAHDIGKLPLIDHGTLMFVRRTCTVAAAVAGVVLHVRTSSVAGQGTSTFAGYTETVPGTAVTFEMLPIQGGTFTIGSPATERSRRADEEPSREVTIRPFWMSKTEVTWDEYDRFAFSLDLTAERRPILQTPGDPSADAVTRPTPPYGDESFGYGKGKQPAISMTQHAAMEYTRWLSARSGKMYRLPTEGEWEYATRAGAQTAYPFGDDAAKLGTLAWFEQNAEEHPHPVATKAANKWGLHDMLGNVAEWCIDLYDPKAYARMEPRAVGPVMLPTHARYPHVVRGGSWADPARLLRSAARRASDPDWSRRDPQSPQSIWWHTDATFVGFRLVRAVDEQDNLKGLRSKITRESPDR